MLDFDELKQAANAWAVPATDISAVRERAGKLRVRRRLASVGISLILLLAAGATVIAILRIGKTDDFRPVPAGDTVEGGQAATFAFHALRETTDYVHPELGPFDYKSVDQIAVDRWLVHFTVGADPKEIAEVLESREQLIEDNPRLSDNSRLDIEKEIEKLQTELQEAKALGGPFDFDISVQQNGETLEVADIEGRGADAVESLLSFTETTAEVPNRGTENWNIRIKVHRSYGIELLVNTFWTGPIPSSYREVCLLSLTDDDGEVVYTQKESRYSVSTAPRSEDYRDWGHGTSGGELSKRLANRNDLTPHVDCHPVTGDGWVAVGEAAIKPVTEKTHAYGSAVRLNPDRHVLISTEVVYRGEKGIESICIARVFDEEGNELSSHGLTLDQAFIEERKLFGEADAPIEIPVDVGDADVADYASVKCQPTVPGVNLGPDQTD